MASTEAASRRRLLLAALAICSSGPLLAQGGSKNKPIAITVWKDAACGCCQGWITHLQAQGFVAEVRDGGNSAARASLGMPAALGSCHTARVGGYVIEGHVPVREILRLLRERPVALGLAVPGMPLGSPGMDGPENQDRREAYAVLLVQRNGQTRPYARYA
jgi:hypothetical protein